MAVNAPLLEPLIYSLPRETEGKKFLNQVQRGQRVLVPLGKKRIVTGVILESRLNSKEISEIRKSSYKIKNISSIDETLLPLPETFLKWLEWMSEYYFYPIGQVCALSFFTHKRKIKKGGRNSGKKSNFHFKEVQNVSSNVFPNSSRAQLNEGLFLKLKRDQKECFERIRKEEGFRVHLLHGVTGSGKTEVYLSLIREKIKQNKQVLVLVPEISLTPQLVKIFSLRFPNLISVIHSYLTQKEKSIAWKSLTEGGKKILVGARSALFCPLSSLGLVVVDEEHEGSYKQNEKLKYHARDAAIMLAKFFDVPIVLVSATPSMESWKKAKEGKYVLHQMGKRIFSQKLPSVQVVDMKEEKLKRGKTQSSSLVRFSKELPFWMSELLYEKLSKNLEKKEQSILFLNRRGEAPLSICQKCGYTFDCPNCSIQLTLHKGGQLLCHYCNFKKKVDSLCPACKVGKIKFIGLGTERIEEDLRGLFKDVKISRADKDAITSRKALEDLIEKMEARDQIQILIGTQMIAKGLHFPYLTLIGFVMVDIGFNFPDFRASEKNFQLITQMSGRSGRTSDREGEVVIQSYNPTHMSVLFSKENNYEGFAKRELLNREGLNYPPYGRLASFRVQGANKALTEKACLDLKMKSHQVEKDLSSFSSSLQILGPSPSPYKKLKNKYRFHLLIKSPDSKKLHIFCRELMSSMDSLSKYKVQVQVDIDPMHML